MRPHARPSRPRTECARQSVSSDGADDHDPVGELAEQRPVHERAQRTDLRLAQDRPADQEREQHAHRSPAVHGPCIGRPSGILSRRLAFGQLTVARVQRAREAADYQGMRTPARALALPAAVALAGALVLAVLGLQTMAFTDYEVEAEPSLLALRHGHPLAFFAHLPAYGGSLILRAPFALLPGAWHGGDLALFRSMAVPCLLASVTLALLLYRRARELGAGAPAAWMALGLVAVNPLTLRALDIGHPEELLGGALCVAAGLAATGRRPLLTGVLLGAAVANKPWALLAVVPVVLMLPEQRRLALATARCRGGRDLRPDACPRRRPSRPAPSRWRARAARSSSRGSCGGSSASTATA